MSGLMHGGFRQHTPNAQRPKPRGRRPAPSPAAALLALLLAGCPSSDTGVMPPGPDDPVQNLAQLDAFANRVQLEALNAAWKRTVEPESQARPAPYGVKPLLLLTDGEVAALGARLGDERHSRCLQAVHAVAVRMQSESQPAVLTALDELSELRQRIPEPGQGQPPDSQAVLARELEPPLRRLIAARRAWAWQRSRLGYLELMERHRGHDPDVAKRLEREVRQALAARKAPPARTGPALEARMAERFDAAGSLRRASFVFTLLGLPADPPALQIREAGQTSFAAFASFAVDPPADHRVTVRAGAGIVPHWSAFHELGHAAMSLLVVPGSCRTMKRPLSPAVSESCAKIAERLFFSEEWLRAQGVPAADVAMLQAGEAGAEVMRMRSILADLELERLLYRQPDARVPHAEWTLKRHLAFEPLARADYLLARCAQAAVYRRLRALPGGLMGEAARKVLRDEVFRGATGLRFEEWFRKAAKAEPNCNAWLEETGILQ